MAAHDDWIVLSLLILLRPLLAPFSGWRTRVPEQQQTGFVWQIPFFSAFTEGFHMFVKVPMLWRVHIVLRVLKISFISSSFFPRPQNPSNLSKWYVANVLQAIHATLWILDYIPGHIFRIEIFNPNSGRRIKLLWRVYFCATAFQVLTAGVILTINPIGEKWLASLQAAISVFNLYYCVGGQMGRLGIRFEGLRPRPAIFEVPYEPIITDASYRDQEGSSVIYDTMGPLAKALVEQEQLEALRKRQEEVRPRLRHLIERQKWCKMIGRRFLPEELQELQELQLLFDVSGPQNHPDSSSLTKPLVDSDLQGNDDPGEGPSQFSVSENSAPGASSEVVDGGSLEELETAEVNSIGPSVFVTENEIEDESVENLLLPSRLTSHATLSDTWTWAAYWLLAILNVGVISAGLLAASHSGGVWNGKLLMAVVLFFSFVSFADQGLMAIITHKRKPLDLKDPALHGNLRTRTFSLFRTGRALFWYPLAGVVVCKILIWLVVAIFWLLHPHLTGMISSERVAPKLAFAFDFMSLVTSLVFLALVKTPS